MAWIESHQELREHPKTKRLCRLLSINRREAVGLLHFLWWWAYDYASEGDLSPFSDDDIADAVDWDGDAAQLVGALVQAGFVDADRRIHDWEDFAEKWIERRRANAERMRERRASRKNGVATEELSHVQNTTIARAPATGPDLTGPDLTGPDPSPPTPSPHGGEEESPPAPRQRGERTRRRERANGAVAHDEPAEPTALAPVSSEDVATWNQALADLTAGMVAGNAAKLRELVPIGRAPDGGLHLRAPPGLAGMSRFRNHVARALLDAGDAAGPRAVIVEARPGEAEHASKRNGAGAG